MPIASQKVTRVTSQIFNDFVVSVIFWAVTKRYSVWIHSCERQKYDFYISQGNV